MPNIDELLRQFRREKYFLLGHVAYPFWGNKRLETIIDFEEEAEPSHRQLRVFSSLINRTQDIRPAVEESLYSHYRDNVYGSMTKYSPAKGFYGADEITPPIKFSKEIWRLIGDPTVSIPGAYVEIPNCNLWFSLLFGCCWDDEHGLKIEFQDWKISEIGGQG